MLRAVLQCMSVLDTGVRLIYDIGPMSGATRTALSEHAPHIATSLHLSCSPGGSQENRGVCSMRAGCAPPGCQVIVIIIYRCNKRNGSIKRLSNGVFKQRVYYMFKHAENVILSLFTQVTTRLLHV